MKIATETPAVCWSTPTRGRTGRDDHGRWARPFGRARDAGIGLAPGEGDHAHAALAYYTLKAAEEGMAAIAMAASVPSWRPRHARPAACRPTRSRSPVPGGEHGPVVLDMSTGVVRPGQARSGPERIGRRDSAGMGRSIARATRRTDPREALIPLPVGRGEGLGALTDESRLITSLAVSNPAGKIYTSSPGGSCPSRAKRGVEQP